MPRKGIKILQVEKGSAAGLAGLEPGDRILEIDGHDIRQILEACEKAKEFSGPVMIIADTVKGRGVSFMENNCGFHGRCCTSDERLKAVQELGGPL